MAYIKDILIPKGLELNNPVTFILDDGTYYVGKVALGKWYYIALNTNVWTFFEKLSIDKRELSQRVQGYDDRGDWPYSRTLEDLSKMLTALRYHGPNAPKKEEKFTLKVNNKHKQMNLNFKL